jgi:hypothetical protein
MMPGTSATSAIATRSLAKLNGSLYRVSLIVLADVPTTIV